MLQQKKTAKTILDVVLISARNISVTSVGDTFSPLSAVFLKKYFFGCNFMTVKVSRQSRIYRIKCNY